MTLRALLFTDVVDSTSLVERLGDARAAELWAEHDRRARDLLGIHKGREIDRTDGFFLLFDAAADAARYALAYHPAIADLELSARVGLHVGALTLRENTADDIARGAKRTEVEGLAKPFAARVMALARGGQTLLTPAARSALGAPLEAGTELESHGHYRLKGVEEPVEVFELGVHGHCAFAPPQDADKAYRVVSDGELWRPVREVRHNLPAERDAFVGRTAELRALAHRLDAGARLLNVLGPGGTGKTRLVRRYGWSWLGDWPGGIYFCDLSEAKSLDGVLSAVAVALGTPLGKGNPVVQLGHAIAGRGRCLVILDNFEQVAEHAGATLGHWLDRAASASFVVTSRERLHLGGEELFAIEPLPLTREAIELFVARARAQKPDFAITDANRAAVAEVVRLLDGLPLAIELAAARVRVLSPVQLVERMRDRFGLLAGVGGAAARQATLRAAIDWSWNLLAPWEQAALAQCSVFEGGFTMQAAEAVLDLGQWPKAPPVMDAVQALVDKSLLRDAVGSDPNRYDIDEPHFGMYVSIHAYARERLLADAQAQAHERHGGYFAGCGNDASIEALSRHGGAKRRRALALELDNLVAACRRAVAHGNAATAIATFRAAWEVLELQGPFAVGESLATQVLGIDAVPASLRSVARWTCALVAWRLGHMEEAQTLLEQALSHAIEASDLHQRARVLGSLGNLHQELGRAEQTLAHQEAALAIHRELGNRRAEGTALGNLGNVYFVLGRLDEARAHYEQGLVIHREVGNRLVEGSVLGNLGGLHHEQGRNDQARTCCQQSLAIHRELGDRRSMGLALGNIGVLHLDDGQMEEARAHFEAALAIHRELGQRAIQSGVLNNLGLLDLNQGRLAQAQAHYASALAIARETGSRRNEAALLGSLGDLLIRQGRVGAARVHLREGEAILRETGDRLELGKLLCTAGQAEVADGNREQGRTVLAEVEALAAMIGAGAGSELDRMIATLRNALA